MARIPIITSDLNAGTAVSLPQTTPQQFGAGIGAQVQAAGQDIAQLALQRRRDDQRTMAGTRLAQLAVTAAQTAAERRQNAAAGGAGHSEAVLAAFDQAAASVLDGIDEPEVANWTQRQIAEERARITINESGWEAGKRAEKLVLDYSEGDNLERTQLYANPSMDGLQTALARRKGVIDGLSGIDGNTREKLWTESRSGLTLSMAQGMAERDPYQGRQLIESGALAGLVDADKLQSLKNRVDVEIRAIEAAQEQARRAAEAEARRAAAEARAEAREQRRMIGDRIRDSQDYLRDGGTIAPAELRQLTSAALQIGRPELARSVQRLGLTSIVNQELRGRSPAEIQASVNALSAQINAAGDKAPAELLIARDAASDKLASVQQQLTRDPLSLAVREGVIPAVPQLDPANPQTFAARVAAGRKVQARYGGALRVLTDEEADSLAANLNGDNNRANQTLALMRLFPRDAALAAAQQIAPKDPLAAHMAGLSVLPGNAGRKVVTQVREGREILLANPKIISEPDAEATRADVLGDALRLVPQLAGVIGPTADAIYAARVMAFGSSKGFDSARYAQAVNDALGAYRGLDGQTRGGIGQDRSGAPTWLPTGISQNDFDGALAALDDAALARNAANQPVDARGKPVPADVIRNARLLPVGDGRYRALVNGQMVMAKGGGPFQLTVRARAR